MKYILQVLVYVLIVLSCNKREHANPSTLTVTRIADNIYSIVSPSYGLPTPENKGWNSNSHFVVTEKGVLLFDTGSSELIGYKIKSAIKSVTNKPVKWVVNSHGHADHWFGNMAFVDSATEFIASNQAMAVMKEHGQRSLDFYSKVTEGTIGSTQLMYPTVLLTQGKKRNFGGVDVEFIFSDNGHSPGDVLMWLPKQEIVFGGDVLSSDWTPSITYHGNVPNLISTLHIIAKLNPNIILTGHGKATTVGSVTRDAEYLSSLWEQVKIDYKNNKKPNEILLVIRAKLNPKYKVLYKDFETEIERHVNLMYELQNSISNEN